MTWEHIKSFNLDLLVHVTKDVVDLVLETARKHFVSFVQDENLNGPRVQSAAVDHVIDSAGSSNDDVDAAVTTTKNPLVFANIGSADAGVTLHAHVVTQRQHHFLDLNVRKSIMGVMAPIWISTGSDY